MKDYSERLEKLGYNSIEEAALDFYIVQRKSSVWIGKVFGVYPTTVQRWLKKYHIPARGKGGADTISGWQKEQVRRLKADGCSNLNIVGISDASVHNIVKEAENGDNEANTKVHG